MSIVRKERQTRETNISVTLDLYGEILEKSKITTGIGFLDHMLELFSFHSGILFEISAEGDTEVDYHHTVEDIGITLGQAMDSALGDRKGISRYGEATIPLEESLSQAVVDLARRPYLYFKAKFPVEKIGNFDAELIEEFFRALCMNALFTLHLRNFYGKNGHHIAESLFKAFAYAMKRALTQTEEELISTKGIL
ncbi:MAG: imidazoleglycerol-phosphate dehydratase HisB [Caldimicrobium sp.]|nr:imidazoleglycerol-phosphate dehydratase HisB [Caldimicrobium sp.]MCX7613916.1 imidazoleglycerol-phosphate dehydratase HisB [Caldimicrobium sp.]MDW8182000.1 imidazoleglycerol-phosphate dehydratase HisB [Caldimicrobium sp.]